MNDPATERVWLAALAGLLHDVGKFAQRAGESGSADSKTSKQDFGYYHALLTYDLIPKLLSGVSGNETRQTLQRAGGYHHRPHDSLGAIVQLADHLSAGEREDDEDNLTPYLESIFFRLGGRKPQGKKGYLPLEILDPAGEFIFPYERNLQWEDACRQEYNRLWRSFIDQAGPLAADSLPVYLEAMLDLLQRYTWCIPSAYYHSVPDVSLYDHSRTTGALAACFAADGRDAAWCQSRMDEFGNEKSGEPVALLVAGDISGVQKFLYSIASEGAARALRGRSVYLQLVTEAVAQYLLQELGLPLTNLLYAGGGNFYLIAPLQPKRPLADLQAEVTRKLFDAHEGNLRLALAWTPVQAAEFKSGAFVRAWDRLHERLRRVKERPLAELTADAMGKEVGTGYGEGGDVTTCPICGREEKGIGDDGCCLCQSFADLGRQVAHATHLVMAVGTPVRPRQRIDRWHQGLEQFGVNVWVVDVDHPEDRYLPGGPDRAEWVRLYPLRKNQDEAREQALIAEARAKLNAPLVRAFRPFAQIVPLAKDGRIKTFDELGKESRGIERWGRAADGRG
jgi:CRISPR-associated protein Csm1